MRTTLTYSQSLLSIVRGIIGLNLCIASTIMNNKTLTLLITSLLMNISLIVSLANDRASIDAASSQLYHMQVTNDSLRGANVKYYQY